MSAKLDYVMDELLEARKLWDTERFQEIALTDSVPEENPTEADLHYAWHILGVERSILDSDDVFFVEPDMHRLILAAMETFEPEPLLSTDLIVPKGYVRLPEPIEVSAVVEAPGFIGFNTEDDNYLANHSAFGWKKLPLGPDPRKPIPPEIEAQFGPPPEIEGDGIMLVYFHSKDDWEGGTGALPALYPGRYLGWPLKDTIPQANLDGFALEWHSAYLYPRVFLRLVMQRLTEVAVLPGPPRAVRRRIERAGYKVPRYSVVRLRKPKRASTPEGEEREAKWRLNYRTLTRGHWRQQWYPSLKAHRQIWIDEFIRGPEDAELVIRPRMFDVRD